MIGVIYFVVVVAFGKVLKKLATKTLLGVDITSGIYTFGKNQEAALLK